MTDWKLESVLSCKRYISLWLLMVFVAQFSGDIAFWLFFLLQRTIPAFKFSPIEHSLSAFTDLLYYCTITYTSCQVVMENTDSLWNDTFPIHFCYTSIFCIHWRNIPSIKINFGCHIILLLFFSFLHDLAVMTIVYL